LPRFRVTRNLLSHRTRPAVLVTAGRVAAVDDPGDHPVLSIQDGNRWWYVLKASEEQGCGHEVTRREGAWLVCMWWPPGPVTGGPQRITIEPAPSAAPGDVARGISTTVLRRLNPVRCSGEVVPHPPPSDADPDHSPKAGHTARRLLEGEGVSPAYLAVLALAYTQLADSGAPAPVRELAALVGRKTPTVKEHLQRARREGLLTTVTGKAGGQLQGKAREVLRGLGLDGSQAVR
jgi:hypothetical protein